MTDNLELPDLLKMSEAARRSGRLADAQAIYQRIVAQHEHPVVLNALGMDALGRHEYAAAAGYFRRAADADPSAPELRMNLAKALREQRDVAGERRALDDVLTIDQRHFMALLRLAEWHERHGHAADAAERWANVLTLAAMAEQIPVGLQPILQRARDYVEAHRASAQAMFDGALDEARATVSQQARRRFDACIDHALGRRRIFVNECSGLHFPFLPADEFFDPCSFPWFAELEAQTQTIRAEFETVMAGGSLPLLPYVNLESGTPDNKWSPLDHSLDWGALHLWKNGQRDDDVCRRFPRTAEIVSRLPLSDLPGRTPTVFFSALRPGAHLPAHTGVSNLRAIVHLPLIVPPGCGFRVGGETREWEVGRAWAFDDTIEHEAWNNSDQTRVILILDVWNPYITEDERGLLRSFFDVASRGDGAGSVRFGVGD